MRDLPDLGALPSLIEAHVRAHLTPPRARTQPMAHVHAPALALLSGLFTQARVDLPPGYMNQPRFRAAYLLYFLPVCAATVLHVLKTSGALHGLPTKPLRVLDVGAGPLTASLAAALALPADVELEVTAIDAARHSLEDGAALLQNLRPGTKIQLIDGNLRDGRLLHKVHGKFDLILAAHVLNEWPKQTNRPADEWLTRLLQDHLAPNGVVVLVEPATRHGSHRLIDVREYVLAQTNLGILSPCRGTMPCPLADTTRDWCHAEQPWQRPPQVVALDEAIGHRRATLKYSHLVLKDGPVAPSKPQQFRVIGGPMQTDEVFRRYLCGVDGRRVAVVDLAEISLTWPTLANAWRGDLAELPGQPHELRRGRNVEPAWLPLDSPLTSENRGVLARRPQRR